MAPMGDTTVNICVFSKKQFPIFLGFFREIAEYYVNSTFFSGNVFFSREMLNYSWFQAVSEMRPKPLKAGHPILKKKIPNQKKNFKFFFQIFF
jgi:hypothetical protein